MSVHSPGPRSWSHQPQQPHMGHTSSPYWLPWLVMDNCFGQSRAEKGELSVAVETAPPPPAPHRWMYGFLNVPEYLPHSAPERRVCLTQALQPPRGREWSVPKEPGVSEAVPWGHCLRHVCLRVSPDAGTPQVLRGGLAGSRHGAHAGSGLGESGVHSCGEEKPTCPNVLFPRCYLEGEGLNRR